jgi:hypothetical protein
MVTIRRALAAVKEDLPSLIEHHVQDLAMQHMPGHRRRELPPVATVLLFVTQVLHGNTAITHLRHLASMTVSGTAYCKARARLPLALFTQLLQRVVEHLAPINVACSRQVGARDADDDDAACRWRGHRVWRGDGTSFSMPDEPCLRAHFGQPSGTKEGCGFPVATLFVLCNAAGMIIKTLALPLYTHDASQLTQLHEALEPGDVLVYDRAGCSYAHLALLFQGNKHAIVRAHQRQIIDFKTNRKHARQYPKGQRAGKPNSQWIRRLGKHDQLVRWFKPKQRPKWMAAELFEQLPDSLAVRELRYNLKRNGFRTRSVTLVTTLLDAKMYPAHELAEQYRGRWQIEVDFRHLKQTMKMNVLKCKTVDGVLKELAVFTLVYNLVRLVMLRAAKKQDVPIDRISFIDALRWLCAAGAARDTDDGISKHDATPTLIINPKRPGRFEPRVIKRRKDGYTYLTQPRAHLRKALGNKSASG